MPEDQNTQTADPQAPVTSINQTQSNPVTGGPISMGQPTPPSQPPSRGNKKKLGLLATLIAGGVVLIGGGAGAYYGVILPSKPENVLQKAAANFFEETAYKGDAKISYEIGDTAAGAGPGAFDMTFATQVDLAKSAFDAKIGLNVLGIKPTIEARKLDRSLYFNVGDLSQIKSVSQLGGPQMAAVVDELNKKIGNQWIEVDESLFKQGKPGSECLLDFPKPFSKEDAKYFKDMYKSNNFVTIKSTGTETLNGRAVFKYDLVVDEKKAKTYSKDLFSKASTFKEFIGCIEKITRQDLDSQINKELESPTATATYNSYSVWVDKKDKTFTKMVMDLSVKSQGVDTKMKLEANYKYENVNIAKPDNTKPLMQVIGEVAPLLRSGTGGGSSLNTLGVFDFNE